MVTEITALACSLKQQELSIAVGTKLVKAAMDTMDANGEQLEQLLDQSAQVMELSVDPNLGTNLDVTG